jgi:hypothetical protein
MDDQKKLRRWLCKRIQNDPQREATMWERHLNEVLMIFARNLKWIPEQDGHALTDDTHTYVYCSRSDVRLYRPGRPPESIHLPHSYFPFPLLASGYSVKIFNIALAWISYTDWYALSETCRFAHEYFHGEDSPFHRLWPMVHHLFPSYLDQYNYARYQHLKRRPWVLLRELRPSGLVDYLKKMSGGALLVSLLPMATITMDKTVLRVEIGEHKYTLSPVKGLWNTERGQLLSPGQLFNMIPGIVDGIWRKRCSDD